MFMLISAAELFAAAGEIFRSVPAILCMIDSHIRIPAWVSFSHIYPALLGYIFAVFYNTVIAVVQTMTTVDPFRGFNKKLVVISLVLGTVFWVLIAVVEFVLTTLDSHNTSCMLQWSIYLENEPGGILLKLTLDFLRGVPFDDKSLIYQTPVILSYMIPSLIVFGCLVIQLVYIRRSYGYTENNAISREGRHASVTVFLVSSLFLVCNSILVIYNTIHIFTPFSSPVTSMFLHFSLPLVNAALYPVIIILRKQSLRKQYKEYINTVCRFLNRERQSLYNTYDEMVVENE